MIVKEIECMVPRKDLNLLVEALDSCMYADYTMRAVSELSDDDIDKFLSLKRLRYKLNELLEEFN